MIGEMINVFEKGTENIIAKVKYNNNLDHWNGKFMVSLAGSSEFILHKGLTRLRNGNFVLITTATQYHHPLENERENIACAHIIEDEQAMLEILKSSRYELFEQYPELTKIRDEKDLCQPWEAAKKLHYHRSTIHLFFSKKYIKLIHQGDKSFVSLKEISDYMRKRRGKW